MRQISSGKCCCRTEVIKDRPVAGAAHALVFWGFCAFSIITINHVATGFGLPLLSHHGAFGIFYFGLAAIFAVAVAVSIAYLAFRRYVLPLPSGYGQSRARIGCLIAALIFILMVARTPDLTGNRRNVSRQPPPLVGAHHLALLIFLPLILHTKHLPSGPDPGRRSSPKREVSAPTSPKLTSDEDFGLVTGKDVTQFDALQAFSCVEYTGAAPSSARHSARIRCSIRKK